MRKIITSLDIGSNSIKLVVGEFLKNNLNILAVSEIASKGLKKGLLVNKEELIPVLKENFHKLEEMLGLPIKEVVLAIPSYEIDSMIVEGSSTITNEDKVVTNQDIIRAMQAASYNKVDEGHELVSIIPLNYKINDQEIVKKPLNMLADKLTVKAVLVTTNKAYSDPLIKVVESIGIKVVDIVSSNIADFTLNYHGNKGVGALINLGEETTSVAIFNKGIIVKGDVIELGGANVDNDIAYIYKISRLEARKLKEEMGLATSQLADSSEIVSLKDRLGEKIVINQKDLSDIIESRYKEILALAKKLMNSLTKKNIDYILLTGGSSEIKDFNILCDKVFTKEHILGKIDYIGVRNNKYSTAVGTILYYNNRLKLKNKEYCCFSIEELEMISGTSKKININENSILGKLFGYFFDN